MLNANLTRRALLRALGTSAAALGLAACGSAGADGGSAQQGAQGQGAAAAGEDVCVRVASLKGPTTIGLVEMMDATSGVPEGDEPTTPAETSGIRYSYQVVSSPDDLLPKVIQGDVDIACVPSNAAAVLYNKTGSGVLTIDVNTLGVLSVVTGDAGVKGFSDLAGRTVYLSGQGSSPEYTLDYLLDAAGIADQVTVEFKSEHTEVASLLATDPNAVGILPEPFTTATLAKNDALSAPVALADVWAEYVKDGSQYVLGTTVVRKDFADEHPDAVKDFLQRHKESVYKVNADPASAAPLVVKAGVVPSEQVAAKAIPGCHVVCETGAEMKDALEGYLEVLFGANPGSVGGSLPGDDFYYGA